MKSGSFDVSTLAKSAKIAVVPPDVDRRPRCPERLRGWSSAGGG